MYTEQEIANLCIMSLDRTCGIDGAVFMLTSYNYNISFLGMNNEEMGDVCCTIRTPKNDTERHSFDAYGKGSWDTLRAALQLMAHPEGRMLNCVYKQGYALRVRNENSVPSIPAFEKVQIVAPMQQV